ncbi:hypothetical protein MRB53_040890 [Persea americana]|nr:hypothetical protein MRB53_040890 [Persea americana]
MLGDLQLYQHAPPRPLFISRPGQSRIILCIGGMGDGLLALPYIEKLLGLPGYSVAQILLSSSYNQWGVATLRQDAEEIINAVDHAHFARISVAILQAPVSDREGMFMTCSHDAIQRATAIAQAVEPDALIDRNVLRDVDEAFDIPMTSYRWLSIAKKGGDDDYFSSDLGHWKFTSTPTLCILGEKDEFVPSNAWQSQAWASPSVKVVAITGANHKVDSEAAQDEMMVHVRAFLTA